MCVFRSVFAWCSHLIHRILYIWEWINISIIFSLDMILSREKEEEEKREKKLVETMMNRGIMKSEKERKRERSDLILYSSEHITRNYCLQRVSAPDCLWCFIFCCRQWKEHVNYEDEEEKVEKKPLLLSNYRWNYLEEILGYFGW